MGRHPLFFPYLALISVCFFWGTTYLGIRMALEGFPPLLLVGIRFLVAGILMIGIALAMKSPFPKGQQLWLTSLYGLMMLGFGTGALVFAETWIPSSLAAVMVTTGPFWLIGIERVTGGDRIQPRALIGLLVGFCGVILLLLPQNGWGSFDGPVLKGFLLLNFGGLFWNGASILQRRQRLETHPFVSGAIQNLACGLVFLPLGLLVPHAPIVWKLNSNLAMIYLVIFGSMVGFSSYVFALERLPLSIVSIYNYVNPAVAAALGVLFYNEPFGWRELLAMLVILVGVAIVKSASSRPLLNKAVS